MVSDTPRETYIIPRRVAQATAIHLSVKIESRERDISMVPDDLAKG